MLHTSAQNKFSCGEYCHPGRKCINIHPKENLSSCSYTDPSNEPFKSEPDDHWVSIKDIRLTHQTLMTQEWLNGNHISAAQCLLKKQHPDISGLQPSTLQYTQTFDVHRNTDFVQCLNLANNYWIMVSTIGCVPGVVNVYDNLNLGLSASVKRSIANLVHTDKPTIVVQQASMQLQRGGSDCGLAVCYCDFNCNLQWTKSGEYPI